jgi:hypothetical protein
MVKIAVIIAVETGAAVLFAANYHTITLTDANFINFN